MIALKRVANIFPFLISDGNIEKAIHEVNKTHLFAHGRPNKTALWVERTKLERIIELRKIVETGFTPKEPRRFRRFDYSANKWRDISEPALWPDQYVHHMLIQALQPVMMRGMDYWCCGSIRGRGTNRGIHGIKRWMNNNSKHTKYCAELDIHHFYESLTEETVMNRMRQLVKDEKTLDLVQRVISRGILIGAYPSQWFANTVLQPLDHLIRQDLHIPHYVRYMDNLTLFSGNKKQLHRAVKEIDAWLHGHGLRLKDNWQVFLIGFTMKTRIRRRAMTERQRRMRLPRMPNAMGYRFNKGFTLVRKRNLLRTKRQLHRTYRRLDVGKHIAFRVAAGLISRLGQFKHASTRNLIGKYVRRGLMKKLKRVVRETMKMRMAFRFGVLGT